jgi:hypothetical protein
MSRLTIPQRALLLRVLYRVANCAHRIGGVEAEYRVLSSRVASWLFAMALESPADGVTYCYLNLATGQRFTTYPPETP